MLVVSPRTSGKFLQQNSLTITALTEHTGNNPYRFHPADGTCGNKVMRPGGIISKQLWFAQLECNQMARKRIIAVYTVAPPSPPLSSLMAHIEEARSNSAPPSLARLRSSLPLWLGAAHGVRCGWGGAGGANPVGAAQRALNGSPKVDPMGGGRSP